MVFFSQPLLFLSYSRPAANHNVCFSAFFCNHTLLWNLLHTDPFSPRNSTVLPPSTYWGQYQDITKSNTHLSVAERLWVAWYAWMQNDVLATGIMSFAIHELFYFGRSLPWVFIDSLSFFNRYKIQSVSGKPNTWH